MDIITEQLNPQIVGVAIKDRETCEIHVLMRPNRHHNIFWDYYAKNKKKLMDGGQGFWLDTGEYINRKDAAKLALANGQASNLIAPPNLYSEDLW